MVSATHGVSIIVPTYNRASALILTLPSYIAENPGEIIVVDDGSTDETRSVVKSIAAKAAMPVHYIRHQRRMGAPAARNTGSGHASGEYILFGEDDVLLNHGYLATLLEDMRNTHADIIAGRIVGMKLGENKDSIARANKYKGPLVDLKNIQGYFWKLTCAPMEVPFVHSVALIQTALVRDIRFDTGYRKNGYREETDFYIRARAHGARIVFTPNAICFHISGDINKSGGQRMNRLAYEFWTIVNNARFVYRNYGVLRELCGWKSGPLVYSCSYAIFRLRRLLSHGVKRFMPTSTSGLPAR